MMTSDGSTTTPASRIALAYRLPSSRNGSKPAVTTSAGGKPVSREDGLRSFGTLLRTGRIEKVTRGHYSLADTSPYLAEARRMGTES